MKTKLRVAQMLLTTMAVAHGLSSSLLHRRDCLDLLTLLPLTTISTMSASSSPSASSTPTTTTTIFPTMPNVPITDKVFFDIRVARQDGSTYVRDDLPDTFENRVLTARLVFGLYGTLAPNHVEQFLKYIVPPQDDDESTVENPYPSYSRSTFTALDQETGLLQGGYVPSLRVTDIGGSTAITYGSRVLPASLWIDKPSSLSSSSSSSSSSSLFTTNGRLSHSVPGLLTHKQLDVTPSFGITTRAAPEVDATHTVFGQVLWDEATLVWFRQLQDIPTYSIDRPVGYNEFQTGGGMATSVFNAQREFFRGAAKAAGDTRVSKLYQGKLMRRMEVMQVGKL